MINESVKSLKKEQVVSPVVSRPVTPPLVAANRLVQACKDEDTLYKCASSDSMDNLRAAPPSEWLRTSRKYIVEDESRYGCRSESCAVQSSGMTTFLRPRMRYTGYQISGYKKYQVMVTLQTADLPHGECTVASPHVTGFLTIRGLTNQHPEITTFFEGFAVMDTVGFLSSAMPAELGALKGHDQIDLEHWLNFPCFKELCMHTGDGADGNNVLHSIINGTYTHRDYLSNRFIYMRWKEKFLVPDAEIDSVEGASYDGYYYIVHDQATGNILGFYYHKDAEKFQQLELVPVYDQCSGDCQFEFN
ncbi:LAFE_0D08878g1_1 [Lachancea fermentati]|uniref:LAFE_0D08878g1_1 n=1 Tax=Lachancea fermentati TaxID=4955 RepID=A0A1G4MBQ9_LACFM|nr:LAFE_0D08878g1_1 [Lachancea fermentati]